MESISLEYLAGILDGEGCILIGKKNTKDSKRGISFRAYMAISNTHIPLLESIMVQFGGRITMCRAIDKTYVLYFSTNEIRDLLPKLVPFLIIKRNQAEILLDFLQKMESNKFLPVSDELNAFYEKCYWQLKDLKKVKFDYKNEPFNMGEKICSICNKSFPVFSTHHYKKFCSVKCKKHARWIKSNETQRTRRLLGSDVPNILLN